MSSLFHQDTHTHTHTYTHVCIRERLWFAGLDCSGLGLSRLVLVLCWSCVGLGHDLVRLSVQLGAVLIIGIIMLNTLHLTF